MLDDKVRKSWELNPSQFSTQNPQWLVAVQSILSKVYSELGLTCGRANVTAELYKLLLYEEGTFFKTHQDSEKTPGMFGTLVISLPSQHEGGQVVLTHNKTEQVFNSAQCSSLVTGTTFGAWYSNVHHEVKPVTSGYRMVLTYNLVQDTSSVRQMASDGSSEARLISAFNMWETALRGDSTRCPPYLIHKLEHQYSKNSMGLNSLHGNDLSIVQCLDRACKGIGFELYLATYEKTVYKDDECDDEVYDRDEEIQAVVALDGQEVDVQPDYDLSFWIEDYDPAEEDRDEDADESSHEGWTGNEGSPARYWYRDTVVMIVPKARKLAFTLSRGDKWSLISKKLPELHRSAQRNYGQEKEQVKQYCEIILSWNTRRSSSSSRFRNPSSITKAPTQVCWDLATTICLENGWLSLFEKLPMLQTPRSETLKKIGHFLATHDVAIDDRVIIESELARMVRHGKRIAEKHDILEKISVAFQKALPTLEQKQIYDSCCKVALKEVLNQDRGLDQDDASALAVIARAHGLGSVTGPMSMTQADDSEFLTAFVLHYTCSGYVPQDLSEKTFLESIIDRIWVGFRYIQDQDQLESKAAYNIAPNATTEGLRKEDLNGLLSVTKQFDVQPISEVLVIMTEAVKDVRSRYVSEQLMEFVKEVLLHEVSALIVEDDSDLFEAVSDYVHTVITAAISRWLGIEPPKPRDWSLPNKGCGKASCKHCQYVAKFMADPQQTNLVYEAGKAGTKHLDSEFGWMSGGVAQYNILSEKSKNPSVWWCTKEHKTYNEAHRIWTERRKGIQAKLSAMGGKNGERLRIYLGDKADAILKCRVEDLPVSGKPGDDRALADHRSSTLNVKNGRKRISDQTDSPSSKRLRGTPGDPVELSD